ITGNFIVLLSSNSLQLIRNVVPHDFSLPFGPLTVNHDGSMVAVWDGDDLLLIDTTTGDVVHRLSNVYWPPQLQGQTSGATQLGCGSATWGSASLINDGTAVEYTMQRVDGDQATVDVYSQPLAPKEVHFAACNLAGRNLSQGEWARYEPNIAYHKTCDQWPAG